VGYAGGTKDNPTYHSLGDHSETIQIDFDPARVSYDALLRIFADNHDPFSRSWSRQYASIIFYHDEGQKRATDAWMRETKDRTGHGVQTEVQAIRQFFLAEDYHQKYYLKQQQPIADEFLGIYPDIRQFVGSTAVSRTNGYLGGYGTREGLEKDLPLLGLSPAAEKALREAVKGS
jgi:peptide-methionine (S)-S-oxide reductase